VASGGGELGLQGADDAVELRADFRRVGLVEDGPDQRGDPGLAGLGDLRQKITKVVKP
jgi:hypothetical protein